jgi:hypothetical protein
MAVLAVGEGGRGGGPKTSGSKNRGVFCLFWYYTVHTFCPALSYITFICRHSPKFLSISSSLAGQLSGKNLPGMPSRGTNAVLPFKQADALPTELCRTLGVLYFFFFCA